VGGLAHIRYKAAVTETEAVVGADNNQPKGPQQKVAKRFNSLTAIDGHDRQYFNEFRARVVSP